LLNRYYTGPEIAQLRLANNKIYGEPAASLNKYSANLNNAKGYFGESIIGAILNLITIETPGAYVCHSVAFKDNKSGETDHVLIYKDRIILIETKSFSGYSSYRVNKEGVLTASNGKGKGFRKVDDSNVFNKVAYYQEQFPNRKVQAILAITRDEVKTWSENGIYKVSSLDNTMQLIRQIMNEAEDVKEPAWAAVKVFATMCVKPLQLNANHASPVNPSINQLEIVQDESRKIGKQSFTNRPAGLRTYK
jgi:hypothetical protein